MTDTKISLADQVAETALEIIQECGPKYWTLGETETDRGYQTRVTWEGPDEVTLEHVETGHVADFRLQVRAVQLPACEPCAMGYSCPAHDPRPQPGLDGRSPADLILQVLEAARRIDRDNALASILPGGPANLRYALDQLDRALAKEAQEMHGPDATESGHWHPTTWGDTTTVTGGARVRVGGQHEATVETVVVAHWVGSQATTLQVKLEGRDQPYKMPPSGPVEVWTPALPEWAGQAFLALAAAFREVDPRG